jgi:hypothetical protein
MRTLLEFECEFIAREKVQALRVSDPCLKECLYRHLLHLVKIEMGGYPRIPRKLKKRLKKQGRYYN